MAVWLVCALSDSILIALGVYGFGTIIEQYPSIITFSKYLGAVFLFAYGAKNLYNALTKTHALTIDNTQSGALWQTVALCLGFTWLNPHVYLDTVILLGSITLQFEDKFRFFLGAISASWLFFFCLAFGARLLAPLFAKAIAWKILDFMIRVVMWALAASLIV